MIFEPVTACKRHAISIRMLLAKHDNKDIKERLEEQISIRMLLAKHDGYRFVDIKTDFDISIRMLLAKHDNRYQEYLINLNLFQSACFLRSMILYTLCDLESECISIRMLLAKHDFKNTSES